MKHLDLFSGIGGFALGLERAGIQTAGFCEIDPYCRKVLRKHWPDVPIFDDIRTLTAESVYARCGDIDLICGGFPCQDISLAGRGAGIDGERSGLWREMFRLVCDIRPRYVLVENSSALLIRGMGRVLADLAGIGYDVEWDCLQAGYFGAPHQRERLYLLAYPNEGNGRARMGIESKRESQIFAGGDCQSFQFWLQTADRFVGMDDGVPAGIYRNRVGALGNAVVPQVIETIGRAIMDSQ